MGQWRVQVGCYFFFFIIFMNFLIFFSVSGGVRRVLNGPGRVSGGVLLFSFIEI